MPVENPTFSELWYRVAPLRMNLRPAVEVRRQFFRGRLWYVLHEPMSNQFARLHEAGYRFVGLFNGRRTIEEAWRTCCDQLGDEALTQGEVIQLLGQLYQSELLQADAVPDVEGLFRRRQERTRRQVKGLLANLLFLRIPLFDPDAFLERWVWLFGKAFSAGGLAIWVVLLLLGGGAAVSHAGELLAESDTALAADKLWLLYACLAGQSLVHEFSHAFACKRLARRRGQAGEVHTMGVMFLVVLPLPYVDVSSAWALRSRWDRVAVNAAGVMADLAMAALAALVWLQTPAGTTLHALAYNVALIAGASTVLFNGNPLLRYDGYYVLSDLLEIPNLSQRSMQCLQHFVKRRLWGVRDSQAPSDQGGELAWMTLYGVAALAYRTLVCASVIWFVAARFFFVGVALAIGAAVTWLLLPILRLVQYLATAGELARCRWRAVGSVLLLAAGASYLAGGVSLADRHVFEGVSEPVRMQEVHAAADGFILDVMESGRKVSAGQGPLVRLRNDELPAELAEADLHRQGLWSRKRQAVADGKPAEEQVLNQQLNAAEEEIARIRQRQAGLTTTAPTDGDWLSPGIEQKTGSFVREGDKLGLVASTDEMVIRATAGQDVSALLIQEADSRVELCLAGRPEVQFTGTILEILPAGSRQLPAQSLGHTAGGAIVTDVGDKGQVQSKERVFEVRIAPDPEAGVRLLAGQRVLVRFRTPDKPLATQCLRKLMQAFQKRMGS